MARVKSVLESDPEHEQAAVEVAIRAKMLKRCAFCKEVQHAWGAGMVDCYKLGNWLITNGSPVVAAFEGDRRAMTNAVDDAVANAGDCCACQRRWAAND